MVDYHQRFPSDDDYLYQHEILEYYDMNGRHDWFIKHAIDYYYDRFHINYYDHEDSKYIKMYKRIESDQQDISDEELRRNIKDIVNKHPIGIDIVSLINEYELKYDGKIFKFDGEYATLTDRLKQLDFVVTSTSSGYIVFDSYS